MVNLEKRGKNAGIRPKVSYVTDKATLLVITVGSKIPLVRIKGSGDMYFILRTSSFRCIEVPEVKYNPLLHSVKNTTRCRGMHREVKLGAIMSHIHIFW